MQEGCVTASGARHQLEQPFLVMATQNPIEQEGTYPLPEAQLDRFFFKLLVGYSDRAQLATIVDRTTREEKIQPSKVMDGAEIIQWQALVREVILAHSTCRITSSGWFWPRIQRAPSRWIPPINTCVGEPALAPPKRWPWPPKSGHFSTAATTSASRTSAESTCPLSATELSSTSRPKPKGVETDQVLLELLEKVPEKDEG